MVSHRESASGDRKDPKSKRQPTVRRDRIQAEPEGTEGPKKRKDCAGRGGPEVGGEGAPGPPDGQAALLRSPLRTTPLWVSGTRLFLLLIHFLLQFSSSLSDLTFPRLPGAVLLFLCSCPPPPSLLPSFTSFPKSM